MAYTINKCDINGFRCGKDTLELVQQRRAATCEAETGAAKTRTKTTSRRELRKRVRGPGGVVAWGRPKGLEMG